MRIAIGSYKIILSESVRLFLRNQIQHSPKDNERGGILLGYTIDNDVYVLKLSTPTSLDKSSRTTFERHKVSAQIVINYEFANSNGEIIYLGEWHTHPEAVPTPSDTDLKMIYNQFHKNKISIPFLLLIIQGLEKTYVGLFDGNNINFKYL